MPQKQHTSKPENKSSEKNNSLHRKLMVFEEKYRAWSRKKKIIFISLSVFLAATVLSLCAAYFLGVFDHKQYQIIETGYVRHPDVSGLSDSGIQPTPFHIRFEAPVAKMELVGKNIEQGIKIFPAVTGRWEWQSQRTLSFYPESDWAPKTTYTVTLPKEIFDTKSYLIKPLEYQVETPPFSGSVTQTEFYEDPVSPKIKRITATLNFTHPVDLESLKENLKAVSVGGVSYDFTLTPARSNRTFYVVSNPIQIKAEEDFFTYTLDNVKNLYNSELLSKPILAKIKIPSASTFFKVNRLSSSIVLNPEKENVAEQVLFVDFSTNVTSSDLTPYFNLYRYSGSCSRFNNVYRPFAAKDISLASLLSDKKGAFYNSLSPLTYEKVDLETDAAKTHLFKYVVKDPRNTCLVAEIRRGLMSQSDFMLHETQVLTTSPSSFPTELKIGFKGAILSFTGEKTLPLLTRGISTVKAHIARIPAESINHLISQTYGDFETPSFNGYFSADNIAENFEETIHLNTDSPEKPNYASLNLQKYFQNRKGIFIAKVSGYRTGESYSSLSDERLILITNLGIIVKSSKDQTHSVFVSDFVTEGPVNGAKVELLGKNGIPVLTAYTDKTGMAVFPNFSNFEREKKPVAYVVSKGEDIAYMPVDRSDRRLNYSRFDTGGVHASKNTALKAFAFSDRGVYRPGEEASFGIIVKDSKLNTPEQNNIKIDIKDSYGDSVFEKRMTVNDSGLLDARFKISPLARTGNYRAIISTMKNGNHYRSIGETSFKVEEFAPETMRIKAKIGDKISVSGWMTAENLEASVTLENLYGSPAADHKVNAEMELIPTNFNFSKFKGYVFQDPMRSQAQRIKTVEERFDSKQTDLQGQAKFNIDLSQYAKGTYRLIFRTEGLEAAGGRSVSTQASVLVSPLHFIIGYKKDGDLNYIKKNAERNIHFIGISPDLEQIEMPDLILETWQKKYVSTLVKQPNGTMKYQSVEKTVSVGQKNVSIGKEGLAYKIDTSTPGDYSIQLVDKKGDVLTRLSYAVAGAQNLSYSLEKNAELQIRLTKKEYSHGEPIQMQIAAPYEGYGLITIEKDSVYAHKWFKAETATSTQEIILPNTVEGNAYVSVAFIRDMNSKEIFMSPLSYAVVPFSINKAKRTIAVDLQAPERVKPGEDLTIGYKASAKGKIILYGVNEGILSYAHYTTPDPLSYFMPKQALRVSTSQTLDLILPDASMVRNRYSTGGDSFQEAIARNLNPFARKVDKPVAFWSGILDVDTEQKTFTYNVPDNFNGQIRIMAVVVNDTAFGTAQNMVYVRGDFAMTPSAPFNVIPGDIFEVGTSVANMVEASKSLQTTLALQPSDKLEVIGDASHTFTLDEGAEKTFKFKVKAKEELGNASIAFVASSDPYQTKMTLSIGMRPGMPYTTDLKSGSVKKSIELKDFSLDLYQEFQTKELLASTSPLVLARGLIKYLDKYPYGCTEQTVSRAFPMIAILFKNPDLVQGVNVYDLFDTALSTLKLRQNNRGGFTAWTSSGSDPDPFASIYAAHFLTYAATRDFEVPSAMLRKVSSYLKEVASKTSEYDSENERTAYAIYVLTLNGEITTNYLINLETHLAARDKKWKDSLAASYIAASYKLLKNDAKSDEIIGSYTLGERSGVKDSRHLFLMATYFPKEFAKIKEQGIEILLAPLQKGYFNSISSAYAILALNAYPSSKEADKKITFSAGTPMYSDFVSVDFSTLPQTEPLTIQSEQPFYYTVNQQGFAKKMPTIPLVEGIEVLKEILDKDGNEITSAKLGDEVTVRLRIKSSKHKYIDDVAVVDMIPGCFEIVTDSVAGASLDSSEIREDRAVLYLSISPQIKEITYRVKVIAGGQFIVPPTVASALYDVEARAHAVTGTFTVEE